MPSTLPDGEPAPRDGALPAAATAALGARPFGLYLHVPFCQTRCGYCDFNTYTLFEVGGESTVTSWYDAAVAELDLAVRVLGPGRPPVDTVFVGGGTPTLVGGRLADLLTAVRERFEFAAGAEVTTEANPETVDVPALRRLRSAGFTRVSFGIQSTAPRVLATLDRVHTPGRGLAAVAEARQAGFDHVSADLIFGAVTESDEDWRDSLRAVAASGVDHVSAYSLIVEPGTRLAARVGRGEIGVTDDDVLAERYLMAEEILTGEGFTAYEISNWATSEDARCRHNIGYWTGGDWWGVGPGAHSHVGGVRWWNRKAPLAYAAALAADDSPAVARERLTPDQQQFEDVMLRLRLASGLPVAAVPAAPVAAGALDRLAGDGLLDSGRLAEGLAVLTVRGRLLADAVTRDLLA